MELIGILQSIVVASGAVILLALAIEGASQRK